ncbi:MULTISPECIES: AraC family transcriptional regulator [unclassified Acinetobacter]|uniref:AraC-like transcriptional regulator QhpR n=1 Tax=unclassified Acinetobacter TaxID=196816 RepID=UPI002934A1F3|nr:MULTISPECIES: AraC family transcriptional regulator [unclassified Acinetobacter]WOE32899.1 AraC family transcriptional regulator [Acinetobacter sp. SAAs470]WOE38376.1 AraC family transcriptional regulator [Acinetobacter sp. SAAs474]
MLHLPHHSSHQPHLSNQGVLSAAAAGLSHFIDTKGADVDRVFGISGIDPDLLLSPTLSLPLASYCQVLEHAARISQCDNFGLYYGQQFQPKALGLIGYIGLCSATLEDALKNMTHYFHLHQKDTLCQFYCHDGHCQFNYQIQHGAIIFRRQDAELTLGMFMNVIREVLGAHYAPRAIHFEHPRPEFWQEHSKLFNAPVYFDQPYNSIILSKSDLQVHMPQADPFLLTMILDSLKILNIQSPEQSLINLVRSQIQLDLAQGEPSLERVAEHLKLSSCTLARKLKSHQLTFTQLIDQVRLELANHYIQQKNLPISEVAFLLGYSEVSAFSRAFKRWFGCTPRQLRH